MDYFDELYSVSDLHMGGEPGGQIFSQGKELAALIGLLRLRPADRKVALVLNGDIVDFLAEDIKSKQYLKPERAVAILERIFSDPAFALVWKALGDFVRSENRFLVICLGNHDVELALPWSRDRIDRELAQHDTAAKSRILWRVNGEGFACQVGPASVFCTHGNEVDNWNRVDYDQLKKLVMAREAGTPLPKWDPNAGTQLVVDVMNQVKEALPFVDLLKPETEIVPPMILSVYPDALKLLQHFGSILFRRVRETVRTGRLGGSDGLSAHDLEQAEADFIRGLVIGKGGLPPAGKTQPADLIMQQMEEDFRAGKRPLAVLDQEGNEATLGTWGLAWDSLLGRPKHVALRAAIGDWLKGDHTFDLSTQDETFTRLDQDVAANYDFVLAGHTHLARALRRRNGAGMYYNSGTWIRLIRLTDAVLGSDSAFKPAYEALTQGTMDAIDRAENLVLKIPTVVCLVADGEQTLGQLAKVRLVDDHAVLEPEPQTRFTKKKSGTTNAAY